MTRYFIGESPIQVLERANLQRALKQGRQNKGAPGIDGMTVDELPEYLRHHWLEIRAQLEAGSYPPQPAKRVEIAKEPGKTRPSQEVPNTGRQPE